MRSSSKVATKVHHVLVTPLRYRANGPWIEGEILPGLHAHYGDIKVGDVVRADPPLPTTGWQARIAYPAFGRQPRQLERGSVQSVTNTLVIMSTYKERYAKAFDRTMPGINIWVKRVYVIAFNAYAWFWIIREIFHRHGPDWENYVLWFFTTAGMHFFVFDSKDIWFQGQDPFKRWRKG